MHDINIYVQVNLDDLALSNPDAQEKLIRTILQKSAGCFLWVRLVVEELTKVHDINDIQLVLDQISGGMQNLYQRTLDSLAAAPYGRSLARCCHIGMDCVFDPTADDA